MTRRRWAHLLLGLAGLVAIGWAVWWGANPQLLCRDEVMGPGDVCTHAGDDQVQTYEERLAANEAARPVVGVVGLLLLGFATYLWIGESAREETGTESG
jgi:hypothetical protein